MLRNIFSFHIHSAQSSNTKFCCKLRSSDRESCYFDVWENESFKTEFHKFSWCTLDHEFMFSEMKCASSTFGFLLIAQKMVSPRGLEVHTSRQSYQKCYQKKFYTCTFFFLLFEASLSKLRFYRLASLLAIPILIARTQVQCSAGLCPWGSWWWWWWFLDNFETIGKQLWYCFRQFRDNFETIFSDYRWSVGAASSAIIVIVYLSSPSISSGERPL